MQINLREKKKKRGTITPHAHTHTHANEAIERPGTHWNTRRREA